MPQFGGKSAKKSFSDSKRHFTVVMGGKEYGLYVSSTPSSAAKKAVTKLCAANKSKKVEFHIREITQGSKKKTYGPYSGYIEKLKEPIELKGRVIKYKPVAKLSGKTDAKKGGMIGGGEIIVKRFKPERRLYIQVMLNLNGKDYNCLFFKEDHVKYSKYYFYNKTTNRYMYNLADYVFKVDDIGGISNALSKGNTIVIRMYKEGSVKDLLGKDRLSNEDLELNAQSIIPEHINLIVYPTYHNSAPANSAPANSAPANSAPANSRAQNNVSGFIYEKIETLEELERLLEFVEKFNFNGDVNTNKPIRKSFRTDDVYQNLKVVIKARILKLDMNKFPTIKTKQYIINMHGEYIPFIIRDTSGKIISVGATHERPLSINSKDYLELHLILAVPWSNKGTGKKSMKLLFDNLPQEYSGIALKPLDGVERFYMNLGYIPYRGGYYFKTKPSE
jgi:hypothetical protein